MEFFLLLIILLIGISGFYFSMNTKCVFCGERIEKKNAMQIPDFKEIIKESRPYLGKEFEMVCVKCKGRVVDTLNRFNQAISRARQYDIWPATYKGKVPVADGSEKTILYSDPIQGKENAKNQLIISSAFLYPECNGLHSVKFDTFKAISGNYHFTAWQASGIPCILIKK